MSAMSSAERTVHQVRNSAALEWLTRAGFIGYGIFHLVVAWLALQIALGKPSNEGDQSGAFKLLVAQPMGKVLVILIVVGLAAMAIWQLLEAAVGHRYEQGKRRVVERVLSAARAVVYLFLAWTALRTVTGSATSSARAQRSVTAGILAKPLGQALVAVAGLVVIGIGVGTVWYGLKRKFERRLKLGEMNPHVRHTTIRLGQVGYAGKGVAFAIVGVLLASAALDRNADKSTGLDGALHTLIGKPWGIVLLALIAAGFAAYGLYCFAQSRYRRV